MNLIGCLQCFILRLSAVLAGPWNRSSIQSSKSTRNKSISLKLTSNKIQKLQKLQEYLELQRFSSLKQKKGSIIFRELKWRRSIVLLSKQQSSPSRQRWWLWLSLHFFDFRIARYSLLFRRHLMDAKVARFDLYWLICHSFETVCYELTSVLLRINCSGYAPGKLLKKWSWFVQENHSVLGFKERSRSRWNALASLENKVETNATF